jgi:hypothetical protein
VAGERQQRATMASFTRCRSVSFELVKFRTDQAYWR